MPGEQALKYSSTPRVGSKMLLAVNIMRITAQVEIL